MHQQYSPLLLLTRRLRFRPRVGLPFDGAAGERVGSKKKTWDIFFFIRHECTHAQTTILKGEESPFLLPSRADPLTSGWVRSALEPEAGLGFPSLVALAAGF